MEIWITRRRYRRVRFQGKARYQVARETGGHALIHDVDQGGLCLRVESPLPQGQRIVLEVEGPGANSGSIEFLGTVAWCTPTARGYLAGIRVYEDDADVRTALTELVCEGLKRRWSARVMRDRNFRYVEYGRRAAAPAPEASSVWKHLTPRGAWKPAAAVNLGF
ncbi:MAG: PilZ domain-containing protein [Candidatus Hydrogenedentes bacterium]|nr:PilZ domain-containing protein [Candidatus Hydrogenedentota bacterium]